MLTERQLEIAARKLCELSGYSFEGNRPELFREAIWLHIRSHGSMVKAVAYALAQPEKD